VLGLMCRSEQAGGINGAQLADGYLSTAKVGGARVISSLTVGFVGNWCARARLKPLRHPSRSLTRSQALPVRVGRHGSVTPGFLPSCPP
jgi:hypothetical protein